MKFAIWWCLILNDLNHPQVHPIKTAYEHIKIEAKGINILFCQFYSHPFYHHQCLHHY